MSVADERVLIVDGGAPMWRKIARTLGSVGYDCVEVGTVEEARAALKASRFDLVVCALTSRGEAGMDLVDEVEAAEGETVVLIVSDDDDPEVAHQAALRGADGYLPRPFTVNALLINVDYALRGGRRRQAAADAELAEERRRVEEVRSAILRLEDEASSADRQAAELLRPLSEAVGRRDLETGAHIRRVGEFSALLAEASGLWRDDVEAIRLAAPMHDVGKVAIPDSVLLKPGRLDPVERRLVERHAEIGHDILCGSSSQLLELAAEIALTHHEKFDGGGYPQGLHGARIPIAGRIVAVADVFDALTSDRPYRPAMTTADAVEIMVAERGTHFDPNLLDLFLSRMDDVQAIARQYADNVAPNGGKSAVCAS